VYSYRGVYCEGAGGAGSQRQARRVRCQDLVLAQYFVIGLAQLDYRLFRANLGSVNSHIGDFGTPTATVLAQVLDTRPHDWREFFRLASATDLTQMYSISRGCRGLADDVVFAGTWSQRSGPRQIRPCSSGFRGCCVSCSGRWCRLVRWTARSISPGYTFPPLL
jgi:hypothetical protein